MRSYGIQKMIWLPGKVFYHPVSKYQRLYEEGCSIWDRNPFLNTLGARTWRDKKNGEGDLITVKQRRFKHVKRLMNLIRRERGEESTESSEARVERIAEQKKVAMHARGVTMQIVSRMARRPLQVQAGFGDLRIVKTMRSLDQRRLGCVVKCGHSVLDKVSRSIFFGNLKKVMKDSREHVFVRTTITETACGAPGMKDYCKKSAEEMCRRWQKRGVNALVLLNVLPRAGASIVSALNNTGVWGRKDAGDFL